MSSNSPSGGMKEMVRSFSKRERRTHWWNFTSSSSTDLLLPPKGKGGKDPRPLGHSQQCSHCLGPTPGRAELPQICESILGHEHQKGHGSETNLSTLPPSLLTHMEAPLHIGLMLRLAWFTTKSPSRWLFGTCLLND